MSKKSVKESTPGIAHATKEGRELLRIRKSFTFNLGIQLILSMKNPFRLFVLPFRILGMLFSKNRPSSEVKSNPRSGIFIIGIDSFGETFSMQADYLAQLILKSNLGQVTLFNNSTKSVEHIEKIEWYRIPPPRDKNRTRKEWNIMIERLLSSALSISRPKHVIFFGDFLYRGVVDSLSPLNPSIPITWFSTNAAKSESIDLKKLPKINPISLPEFSETSYSSQSIHRILQRPDSKRILLLDILPENNLVLDCIIQSNEKCLVTAVQKEFSLPKEIEHVVRMNEVIGMQLEGNVIVVIDDESPLLPSLAVMNVSCLLLRTGKDISPILDEMVRDMELKGTLVVVRRNDRNEIIQSLDYLFSISNQNPHIIQKKGIGASPKQTNYVIKWLEKYNQPYN